jgi:uncharacterized membrane protein
MARAETDDQTELNEGSGGLNLTRVEAFSDGVFAIAITLLVLELTVPEGSEDDLLEAIVDQWPSYLAYVVSFATIGATWLRHAALTHHLQRVDAAFVRLNLLVLMVVASLPFPTRLLGEYAREDDAERVAATVFGVALLVTATLVSALWRHAIRAQLLREDVADDELEAVRRRMVPGLGGYVVMIALGLFLPVVAVVGYLLIAVFYLVPFGMGRRGIREP